MRKRLSSIITLVISVVFIASCSKDDDVVPSYQTDLVCLFTGNESEVTKIRLDNGRTYDVSSQGLRSSKKNDTIRCLAKFMVKADSLSATIYQTKTISCYAPMPADSFKVHPHYPLNIKSVWKSGGYINMCLSLLTNGAGAKHRYDFSIDSLRSRTMHVSMLFQRDTTVLEAYTSTFYHSIPLRSRDYKQDFDSIILHINTHDGIKTYAFKR